LVRYSNEEEARMALRHDNKTKLDKKHTLRVSLFGNESENLEDDDGTSEFKPPVC
jgi:hypothetical protein